MKQLLDSFRGFAAGKPHPAEYVIVFYIALVLCLVVFGGCEFLQRMVDSAGGPEKVIEGGFKLAEMVVPWPFDILLPGVASLVTALVMPKEDPSP